MSKLIALCGQPLSGKSSIAQYLQDHRGYFIADHGRFLVLSFVSSYNRANPKPISVEDVYANKGRFRQHLINHAEREGFHARGRANSWIGGTLSQNRERNQNIVFDSYRGKEQADALLARGFSLIEISITEAERMKRAGGKDAYERLIAHIDKNPSVESACYAQSTVYGQSLERMVSMVELLA